MLRRVTVYLERKLHTVKVDILHGIRVSTSVWMCGTTCIILQ